MGIIKKGSKQYKENLKKQQFLNRNGIKVKLDGSWGKWQEQQYKKLITKDKHYQPTILGLMTSITDNLSGNTTYEDHETQITPDDRTNFGRKIDYALSDNNNPYGYIYQTILPASSVVASVLNPAIATRSIIPGVLVGGTTSYLSNEASKAITDKTTEELVSPYTGNTLSFLGNPGTYAGGKTGYNFKNLGRFVMDYVEPANYSGHGSDFIKAYTKALNPFSRIPTFFKHRPNWYKRGTINGDQQFRLENMAEWVGIPEKEISRIVTRKNPDGTRGFNATLRTAELLPDANELKVGQKVSHPDLQFGLGGEHSDFTLVGKSPEQNLWLYEDEQKLNPQYLLTDKIKQAFNINQSSKPKLNKFIDLFAKRDLKWLLGFDNDVKYKQYILENNRDGSVLLVTRGTSVGRK